MARRARLARNLLAHGLAASLLALAPPGARADEPPPLPPPSAPAAAPIEAAPAAPAASPGAPGATPTPMPWQPGPPGPAMPWQPGPPGPAMPWQPGPPGPAMQPYPPMLAPIPASLQVPPPPPSREPPPGVTRAGIPLGQRGYFGVDTASFAGKEGARVSGYIAPKLQRGGSSIVVAGSLPLTPNQFFELRLPLAFAGGQSKVGNVMLGTRAVVALTEGLWFVGGGAVGLPTLTGTEGTADAYQGASIPRALWDLHELYPGLVPLVSRLGFEAHFDFVALRGGIDPTVLVALEGDDDLELTLQHAIEVQIGHATAVGLRMQGVVLPTFHEIDVEHFVEGDVYQLALEPFFVLERRLGFARVGLMLPIGDELGPPFEGSWGGRVAMGVRVE